MDRHSVQQIDAEKRNALHELNKLIGQALGLAELDIAFIEADCETDSFLKRIKPRYPGSVTRKQGFRSGLNAASRYGAQ